MCFPARGDFSAFAPGIFDPKTRTGTGAEIRNDQFNQDGNLFARGSFGFEINATRQTPTASNGNAFADFLLGEVRRPETAVAIGSALFRANSFNIYVDALEWRRPNPSRGPCEACGRSGVRLRLVGGPAHGPSGENASHQPSRRGRHLLLGVQADFPIP